METSYWKKCSNCKKEIPFECDYYKCNVSTCNHERTGLQFCSVSCWSAHVPIYRHRDSWALEAKAPTRAATVAANAASGSGASPTVSVGTGSSMASSASAPSVIRVDPHRAQAVSVKLSPSDEGEILVVVSKLKAFIKAKSDMNTSADVMEVLSDKLRRMALDAIVKARADGRKTVMGRDF